ncbi:hypothetical protein U9M48_021285 [Paspalum notatum var. saurae]|uniref:Mitochondrial carrier protein n=1 Tax=Paspalum notatum var. saurae TaxID=547442 RepID=A0AAQ3WSS5_PASNO
MDAPAIRKAACSAVQCSSSRLDRSSLPSRETRGTPLARCSPTTHKYRLPARHTHRPPPLLPAPSDRSYHHRPPPPLPHSPPPLKRSAFVPCQCQLDRARTRTFNLLGLDPSISIHSRAGTHPRHIAWHLPWIYSWMVATAYDDDAAGASSMEFWPEFLATSGGREFVAGGVGGMAGVLAGHPLDTLRIRLQQPPQPAIGGTRGILDAPPPPSAARLLRAILRAEGPAALYRGMAAPLASVAFQNAMVFQVYAILSRSLDAEERSTTAATPVPAPPSYTSVALAGVGTGALQTLILSPVELVKIRLQLEAAGHKRRRPGDHRGPVDMARDILRREGLRGLYRGLAVTALRDAPAHGVYFWAYERARERLHPGCRSSGGESLGTMLVAGGLAGVASWVCCYPLDVVKSRLQAQGSGSGSGTPRYRGVVDCVRRSVREEGLPVLWRGLGTAVARAFVVNGAIFSAYELALRFLASGGGQRMVMEEN